LLPTQYQLGISDTSKTICLIDSPDISGIEGEVYDQMTILSKLLSLPETYNDYELFLSGVEDASEHSTSIVVKNINTVRILNTPGDESQVGICLLGPVRNPDTTSVYYTEIVIEDEKALELVKSDEFVSLLDAYFPTLNGYDHLYYLDDENGKLTINSYSDQAHSDMFLAMLDGQYSGVYFQRTCLDGTESVYFTNDVESKYWKQYFLKITFADTRDCQTKCGTHVRCSDNGEYYISMMF
jgi:hypothetical protein